MTKELTLFYRSTIHSLLLGIHETFSSMNDLLQLNYMLAADIVSLSLDQVLLAAGCLQN